MNSFIMVLSNGDEAVSVIVAAPNVEDAMNFLKETLPKELMEPVDSIKVYEPTNTTAICVQEGRVVDTTDLQLIAEELK